MEFDKLIDWIYAPEDKFREKRAGAIAARNRFVQMISTGDVNYKEIQEIIDYDANLTDHNIEQLSAKLLLDLTRNTGFEVLFYCGRGKIENFIKEGKIGFDFSSVSSYSMVVNANRLQVHALAYNLFNWFRRLVLSANMRKQRIDTIRLKLLKIAAKAVHSARYIIFKLCSSCHTNGSSKKLWKIYMHFGHSRNKL